MIFGIGTDIVQVARLETLWQRHGERAARRILAPDEWEEFSICADPARLLAKRFAAKEAFAKALGTGVRAPASLTALAITHDALGKPGFAFAPPLARYLENRHLRAHLSLSDEKETVLAFVVLETLL